MKMSPPCPDSGIVSHVVVRRKKLDLGFAAVDDEHDVINCNASLGNVRRQDHLCDALTDVAEHLHGSKMLVG